MNIIKIIGILLIGIMLCTIPVMAAPPHDCDLNNDGYVNYDDSLIIVDNWGYHPEWNFCDWLC